ncbi:MAG: glycosyltransferase family 2 protein [Candidatus Altiarchaeota archaeon]|nr:glycosyltransferase family 2 protein [Candidatus Altiarchaeota archaeon]
MKVSVVSAAYNEEGNVSAFLDKLRSAMSNFDYEIVVVDDGSTDNTYGTLVMRGDERLRVIRLDTHMGKDYALYTGLRNSAGDIIATLDSDLQDEPLDLPVLINMLGRDCDMACGWRRERKDTLVKRLSSFMANAVYNIVFGMRLHDTNCPVKAFRKECVAKVRYFKNFHRFIAVMARLQGFRVRERVVTNYPRIRGVSNYGMERFLTNSVTLLTVRFKYRTLLE